MIKAYLEENLALEALEKVMTGGLPEVGFNSVRDLVRRLNLNEYKRRQGAPILKVSQRAFGIGRRVPIAKKFWRDVSQMLSICLA